MYVDCFKAGKLRNVTYKLMHNGDHLLNSTVYMHGGIDLDFHSNVRPKLIRTLLENAGRRMAAGAKAQTNKKGSTSFVFSLF